MEVTTDQLQQNNSKQPKQLYLLFFAEMWERFSFYGMKALLIAYMVSELNYDDPKAYAILGSYAALVYTMPMFGGFMADKFIGYQRAVMFGGILMTLGHFILALPTDWSFFMEWLLLFVAMVFSSRIFQAWLELCIVRMIREGIVGFLFFIWGLISVLLSVVFYVPMLQKNTIGISVLA